jgi:hypothetical protein
MKKIMVWISVVAVSVERRGWIALLRTDWL